MGARWVTERTFPIGLWFCGAAVGVACGTSEGQLGKPVVEFPSQAKLAQIESQPAAIPTLDVGEIPVTGWQLDAHAGALHPDEPFVPSTSFDVAFATDMSRAHPGVHLTRALGCVAREAGRYYLEAQASPPDNLEQFIIAACGAVVPQVGHELADRPHPRHGHRQRSAGAPARSDEQRHDRAPAGKHDRCRFLVRALARANHRHHDLRGVARALEDAAGGSRRARQCHVRGRAHRAVSVHHRLCEPGPARRRALHDRSRRAAPAFPRGLPHGGRGHGDVGAAPDHAAQARAGHAVRADTGAAHGRSAAGVLAAAVHAAAPGRQRAGVRDRGGRGVERRARAGPPAPGAAGAGRVGARDAPGRALLCVDARARRRQQRGERRDRARLAGRLADGGDDPRWALRVQRRAAHARCRTLARRAR